jgi:hypothetical protein
MQTKFFKIAMIALFASAFIVSCSDDDKEPAKVPAEMKLDFPAGGATIDMQADEYKEGIELKWLAVENVSSYILEVSNKDDFSNLLVNISGNQTSYAWTMGDIDTRLEELGIAYEEQLLLYWRVKPANPLDFSEVIEETRSFLIVRRKHPGLYGEWLFDTSDYGKATTGTDLEVKFAEQQGDYTLANQFALVDGPVAGDKACRIGAWGWFICRHGIPAEKGDEYVSRYTLLTDIKFNNVGNGGSYHIMACTNLCWFGWGSHGANRPESCTSGGLQQILQGYSVMPSNAEGTAQYSIALSNATYLSTHSSPDDFDDNQLFIPKVDTWYRMVLTVDLKLTTPRAEVWIDGIRRVWPSDTQLSKFTADLASTRINWLPEGVVLAAGSSGGSSNMFTADYARIAIWDYALTKAEVEALGVAGDPTEIGR